MRNIIIVSEVKSFSIRSIREKLEGLDYSAVIVPADEEATGGYRDALSGIIIYTDETLLQPQTAQLNALQTIRNKVQTDGLPLFVIGDPEDMAVIYASIPRQLIRREFIRPIDTNKTVADIHTMIERHNIRRKILVVDDSGASLRNVKSWLEDKYDVCLANSGTMAIKYLALNRPDLVLLDYEMPVADGRQVLEMIRSEEEFADIPVMFLTSKKLKEGFGAKGLHPAEGYLLKSMEPQKIVSAIDEFFDRPR